MEVITTLTPGFPSVGLEAAASEVLLETWLVEGEEGRADSMAWGGLVPGDARVEFEDPAWWVSATTGLGKTGEGFGLSEAESESALGATMLTALWLVSKKSSSGSSSAPSKLRRFLVGPHGPAAARTTKVPNTMNNTKAFRTDLIVEV